MAEFKDVIKQQKRMCQTVGDCNKCPLRSMEYACRFMAMIDADYDEAEVEAIERIVMDWAAANPEPRYPTWTDGWRQLFPESKFIPCHASHFGLDRPCAHNCAECKEGQMTADIAEKLGIKPIGGKDNA